MNMLQRGFCNRFTCVLRKRTYASWQEGDVKKNHPFRGMLSRKDAIQHLANNIIFNGDEIVVFNKPPGIAKTRPKLDVKRAIDDFYMDEILGEIPALSDCAQPLIAKFPERYSSGIMIVCKTDEAYKKLAKCKLRAKQSNECSDTHLVISLGRPVLHNNKCKLALKLSEGGNKKTVPILADEWSKHEMKSQKVKLVRIQHEMVSTSSLASLSRISMSTGKSNALRLYFATKLLSPVLGDNIFSGRVKGVFGVPLLIDPHSPIASSPKKIPLEVLSALSLSSNDTTLVPLFVHLEEVHLPMFRREKDLILRAPPPDIFSWTCGQLQLSDCTLDAVQHHKEIDAQIKQRDSVNRCSP